jgi:hypothetical protein
MLEARSKEKASKGVGQKGSRHSEASPVNVDKGVPRPDGTVVPKSPGRQSELTGTVDQKGVLNRILDMQVPMSLREIMVTSKEICTEIQDLIKVKNVRAVLLGKSANNPFSAR